MRKLLLASVPALATASGVAALMLGLSFIKSVERMRGPGLALAPTAMTGMNDQWCSDQTISDLPARASAFHVQLHRVVIVSAFDYRNN